MNYVDKFIELYNDINEAKTNLPKIEEELRPYYEELEKLNKKYNIVENQQKLERFKLLNKDEGMYLFRYFTEYLFNKLWSIKYYGNEEQKYKKVLKDFNINLDTTDMLLNTYFLIFLEDSTRKEYEKIKKGNGTYQYSVFISSNDFYDKPRSFELIMDEPEDYCDLIIQLEKALDIIS